MAVFVENNGFNPLPAVVHNCGKKTFSTLQSNTLKQVNPRKRTSLSATEQVTIGLQVAVLGQKLLTRLIYLIVLKVQATVFSGHYRLSSAAVVLLHFCLILLCHISLLFLFLLFIFFVFSSELNVFDPKVRSPAFQPSASPPPSVSPEYSDSG